jgi:excisionase family DNA binding protein
MNVSKSRQESERTETRESDSAEGPLLLRVAEAAKLLGVGETLLYELIGRGVLPSIRLGRAVRVPRAALAKWVAASTRGAPGGTEIRTRVGH